SDFDVDLSAAALGRILMRIRTRPGEMAAQPDLKELEKRLVQAMRGWEDDLYAALVERDGEQRANLLWKKYQHAFPAGYREGFGARDALADIEKIEALAPERDFAMSLRAAGAEEPGMLRFKIYRPGGERMPLSDTVPLFKRLGVRVPHSDTAPLYSRRGVRVLFEHPHKFEPAGAVPVWVVDFGLIPPARA